MKRKILLTTLMLLTLPASLATAQTVTSPDGKQTADISAACAAAWAAKPRASKISIPVKFESGRVSETCPKPAVVAKKRFRVSGGVNGGDNGSDSGSGNSDRVIGQTETRPDGLGGRVTATATGNGTGGNISTPDGDAVTGLAETQTPSDTKTAGGGDAPDPISPDTPADSDGESKTVTGLAAG